MKVIATQGVAVMKTTGAVFSPYYELHMLYLLLFIIEEGGYRFIGTGPFLLSGKGEPLPKVAGLYTIVRREEFDGGDNPLVHSPFDEMDRIAEKISCHSFYAVEMDVLRQSAAQFYEELVEKLKFNKLLPQPFLGLLKLLPDNPGKPETKN
jgi:hypothetical protein